jgi:hypothetical protein
MRFLLLIKSLKYNKRRLAGRERAIRRRPIWLSAKSIFAPTEVAASLALIALVIGFALVYMGASPQRAVFTYSSPITVSEPTAPVQLLPGASAEPSAVAQPASSGLGTILRALSKASHPRPSATGRSSPMPSPTDIAISPSPSDTPTPMPTASDIPTPTPTETPPIPGPTDTPPAPTPADTPPVPTPTDTPPVPTPTDTPPVPTPSPSDTPSPSPSV